LWQNVIHCVREPPWHIWAELRFACPPVGPLPPALGTALDGGPAAGAALITWSLAALPRLRHLPTPGGLLGPRSLAAWSVELARATPGVGATAAGLGVGLVGSWCGRGTAG
jgi:hypothetical protein